ncbi:hypothetical protein [Consotaella salsifontis]|uniref:Uncharacterized protein n=1 Tax=Consotaella salsifontis TaxID=1365950 RepID=A0A1T4SEH0_9HYPH|nr:hypothetical protein [Consotaella salsifontis]SKA26674.1 hypothetical protein SAMN05428963_110110 [Consotaella salsifontis]
MSEIMREFASSSNGDRWFLCRDEVTANGYVLHQANLPSGGSKSRIEIGDFLGRGSSSPEHQALLHLIGTLVNAPSAQTSPWRDSSAR